MSTLTDEILIIYGSTVLALIWAIYNTIMILSIKVGSKKHRSGDEEES